MDAGLLMLERTETAGATRGIPAALRTRVDRFHSPINLPLWPVALPCCWGKKKPRPHPKWMSQGLTRRGYDLAAGAGAGTRAY